MAQWLNWGDGHNGSPAVSGTINTYATCTGTAGQTVLTTTLSASDGDQILIHQTQHASAAGTWEIVKVSSDAGATLNLYTALVNSYSTGAQAVLIPQYTGGTISGAVTGTAWNGSVGGIIALMSSGDLVNTGSLTINGGNATSFSSAGGRAGGGTGGGFRGGNGYNPNGGGGTANQGEGITGGLAVSYSNAGNGAGGGDGSDYGNGGGGGNGAAGGTGSGNGNTALGGIATGVANLTTMTFGGGGGGGIKNYSYQIGGGGAGAGIVLIIAKTFDTSAGTVNLLGGNGASNGSPGGGSGAGGSCLIKCQTAVLGTNKINASAGSVSSNQGTPGTGGVGRIRCDYFASVSGSTTPALSSAQDLTLNVAAPSGFFNFF